MAEQGKNQRKDGEGAQPLALTFRLLRRVKKHRGMLIATLLTMIIAAVAETAPIALAKVCVGVIFDAGTGDPSEIQRWFSDTGMIIAGWLGIELSQPRLAALALIVVSVVILGLVTALATYTNTVFCMFYKV